MVLCADTGREVPMALVDNVLDLSGHAFFFLKERLGTPQELHKDASPSNGWCIVILWVCDVFRDQNYSKSAF